MSVDLGKYTKTKHINLPMTKPEPSTKNNDQDTHSPTHLQECNECVQDFAKLISTKKQPTTFSINGSEQTPSHKWHCTNSIAQTPSHKRHCTTRHCTKRHRRKAIAGTPFTNAVAQMPSHKCRRTNTIAQTPSHKRHRTQTPSHTNAIAQTPSHKRYRAYIIAQTPLHKRHRAIAFAQTPSRLTCQHEEHHT